MDHKYWLGWQESNLRMSESKSDALPLGYTPLFDCGNLAGVVGFEPTNAGVRDPCLTAWLHPNGYNVYWGERWGSNPRPPEPQSGALAN